MTESELIGCAEATLKDLQPKVKDILFKLVQDLETQRDRKHRGLVGLIFHGTSTAHPLDLIPEIGLFHFLWGTSFRMPLSSFTAGVVIWVHNIFLNAYDICGLNKCILS